MLAPKDDVAAPLPDDLEIRAPKSLHQILA